MPQVDYSGSVVIPANCYAVTLWLKAAGGGGAYAGASSGGGGGEGAQANVTNFPVLPGDELIWGLGNPGYIGSTAQLSYVRVRRDGVLIAQIILVGGGGGSTAGGGAGGHLSSWSGFTGYASVSNGTNGYSGGSDGGNGGGTNGGAGGTATTAPAAGANGCGGGGAALNGPQGGAQLGGSAQFSYQGYGLGYA